MIIRPFRPADQPAVQQLILAGLAERWGELDLTLNEDLHDIAGNYDAGIFLIAEIGSNLVGTGAIMPEGEGIMRVLRMYVAKDRQRQGVGKAILSQLIVAARGCGCRQLVVETEANWLSAVNFYLHSGFQTIYIEDGEHHMQMWLDDKR